MAVHIIAPGIEMVKAEVDSDSKRENLFGHVQFEMPRRYKEMPSRCFKVVNLEVKKKSSPPI